MMSDGRGVSRGLPGQQDPDVAQGARGFPAWAGPVRKQGKGSRHLCLTPLFFACTGIKTVKT